MTNSSVFRVIYDTTPPKTVWGEKYETKGLVQKKAQPKRSESELQMHRCAFTVHRPARLYGCEANVIVSLWKEPLSAIKDGYITFITGYSTDVDLWAADNP